VWPGRDADTSPLLVTWSWKSRALPLLPLWTIRPVQSLSACTRAHFTFTLHLKISERQSVAVSYVLQHNFHVLLTDLQMTPVPSAILQFILSSVMQPIKYLPKVEVSLLVLLALHQYAFIRHMVLATSSFRSPILQLIQPVQLKHAFQQSSYINISNHFKVQIKIVLYMFKDPVRTAR